MSANITEFVKKIENELNSASTPKELANSLKRCKVICIAKVIEDRGYDKDSVYKFQKFIKNKASKEYDKYVKPLYKKRLVDIKLNKNTKAVKKSESPTFNNYKDVLGESLEVGQTIYSRDISGDKNWDETLQRGGRMVTVTANDGIRISGKVDLLTPRGIVTGFNINRMTMSEFDEFLMLGAKVAP